jgi:hypothetical protein
MYRDGVVLAIWTSSFENVLFSSVGYFSIGSLIWGDFSFFEFLLSSGYQSFV